MASPVKGRWRLIGRFHSILFDSPDLAAPPGSAAEPAFFTDLNLDQVRDAMLAGREEYDLAALFQVPLPDPGAVRYRQAVLRDLQDGAVREPIEAFADRMRSMRGLLARSDKAHYELHRQRLRLEAIDTYCDAVLSLSERLCDARPQSPGLGRLLDYLSDYTESDGLTSLVRETQALLEALGEIRYALHIRDARIGVGRHEGEPDYGATVTQVFAKFSDGEDEPRLAKVSQSPDMNHVEAQVLTGVARLFPEAFATLAEYCQRHRRFVDTTIGAFDREVQFCLAWLEYIAPLEAAGLDFCLPEVAAGTHDV